MSIQYDLYLLQHKEAVAKAFHWFYENLTHIVENASNDINALYLQICYIHDASKNDPEEYDAYDRYFYGNNRSYQVQRDFDYAWLHHIHNNPHHWQYWILQNDEAEEGTYALDIPDNYILEMICDWWSFSWRSGNLFGIFDWWESHKNTIRLSPATREKVVDILNQMKERLGDRANETTETSDEGSEGDS